MDRLKLEELVIKWREQRNLNDPVRQTLNTLSEAGALADAVCKTVNINTFIPFSDNKEQYNDVIDAIGDIEVCLIILKHILGLEQTECLEYSYNQINNRTGESINGTFIKD